jgi:hypothetical protein
MTQISFDASALKKFVHENELGEMQAMVNAADSELRNGTGPGPTSATGCICQRNMIMRNLTASSKRPSRFNQIQKSWS